MEIRQAELKDIPAINEIDAACFDAAVASDDALVRGRINHYANHFWVVCEGEKVAGYINGFCTDKENLEDEMLVRPELHEETGAWQMLFGLAVDPVFQCRGFASALLQQACGDARLHGRKGLVLTCKDRMVPYYQRVGYVDEGFSVYATADGPWHLMRLRLE